MSARAHALAYATALGLAVVAAGCAGKLDGVVRSQAAFDLSCPEDQVIVSDLRTDGHVRDFSATGCGRQVHYQAACSTVGACTAYRAGEVAEHGLPASDGRVVDPEDPQTVTAAASQPAPAEVKPEDPAIAAAEVAARAAAAEPVLVVKPPETVTETAQGTVEAVTPPPVVVLGASHSVTLRNECPATVTFFIGEKPGESVGRYMRLGSTSMTGPTLRTGEQVWLLDAKQSGLTSVSVADSTREIVVAESCSGLVSR